MSEASDNSDNSDVGGGGKPPLHGTIQNSPLFHDSHLLPLIECGEDIGERAFVVDVILRA